MGNSGKKLFSILRVHFGLVAIVAMGFSTLFSCFSLFSRLYYKNGKNGK
jgi:hypothetical protein